MRALHSNGHDYHSNKQIMCWLKPGRIDDVMVLIPSIKHKDPSQRGNMLDNILKPDPDPDPDLDPELGLDQGPDPCSGPRPRSRPRSRPRLDQDPDSAQDPNAETQT